MPSKIVARASVVGVAAALAVTAPAFAATTPTLAGPAGRTGYGTITLTGTAEPGAAVHLYESAIIFNDLKPADDWEHGGGTVTATADSTGHYSIVRYLDTGFFFEAESGGARSAKITVHMRVLPGLWLETPRAGVVRAHVEASPNEPTLPVQIQQARSGGTWRTVATGKTNSVGAYAGTVSGVSSGSHSFRAYIGADPANGMLANYSVTRSISVAGGHVRAPAPVPAAGSVQFTRIQYNSPGWDNGSNTSLNGEWVRITNRSSRAIGLRGWTVRDATAHVYTFTSHYHLRSGQSVTVYTGKGTAATGRRYWGHTGYVWDNGGDSATLRTGAGRTIDSCKWGNGSGVTTC
jgi:hypothetical protein